MYHNAPNHIGLYCIIAPEPAPAGRVGEERRYKPSLIEKAAPQTAFKSNVTICEVFRGN